MTLKCASQFSLSFEHEIDNLVEQRKATYSSSQGGCAIGMQACSTALLLPTTLPCKHHGLKTRVLGKDLQ